MKHNWLRLFDVNGKWTLPERKIVVGGVEHDLDEYAKQHGVELPDANHTKPTNLTKHTKPTKKADIEVNIDGDMGQTQDESDTAES